MANGITFDLNGGNNYLFSDNPEDYYLPNNTAIWNLGGSVSTAYKDMEYYHFVSHDPGTYNATTGIAVYNDNTSAVTVTYKGATATKDEVAGLAQSVARRQLPIFSM